MRITRVDADAQGESHFADLEIALRNAGSIGNLLEAIPAKAIAPDASSRVSGGRCLSYWTDLKIPSWSKA